MSAKGYTDQSSVQNYLLESIDGSFLPQLDLWIEAMENYIDQYTNRNFIADADASTRLFEGRCSNKLLIDECIAITKVEQGDLYGENFTEINSNDYQTLPYNDTPKDAVGLKRTVWGKGLHRITAKWGYSAQVPAAINFVATVLVSGILNTQIGKGTAVKRERIGNYEVIYSDQKSVADFDAAMAILDQYKRITL